MPNLHHPDYVPQALQWYDALIKQRGAVIASDVPQSKRNTIAHNYAHGDVRVRMTNIGARTTGTNQRQQYVVQYRQGRNTTSSQYGALIKRIRQQFLSMIAQQG